MMIAALNALPADDALLACGLLLPLGVLAFGALGGAILGRLLAPRVVRA